MTLLPRTQVILTWLEVTLLAAMTSLMTSVTNMSSLVVAGSAGAQQYCEFPDFLWQTSRDHVSFGAEAEKHWSTETMYPLGGSVNWTSQREVSVRATQITVKVVSRAVCVDVHSNTSVGCPRKNLLHRIVCMSEEPDDNYLVQIRGNSAPEYSCMKFIARGRNVVQVWIATPSKTNDNQLCLKESMRRDSWPWIVQRREQWSFCPFTGGFDFRVMMRARRKKVCKHQWRPSRIESECILGEGIQFQFPDDRCTVLDVNPTESALQCWGGWIEDDYMFSIIGRSDTGPQYTLRLPKDADSLREFTAEFYHSPIAPLQRQIDEIEGVAVASLQMIRSDPGVCYDESEFCQQFARDGKCINAALHKFANFCKKSCGLCGHKADLVPSVRSECYFPDDYRGSWQLFETDRQEEVVVEAGQVIFSQLGKFICKSKHWKKDQYKILSVYHNGCRPRYSCMHFRLDGLVLYFQLSRSSLLDRSFDLCEFRDDPEPLRDKIRSRRMKLLLPENRMRYNQCSLSGTAPVNVSFANESSCQASLSDWDSTRCNLRPSLQLIARPCHRHLLKEYRCVAQIDITDGTTLLMTQDMSSQSSNYQCWVIQTYSERMSYRPWKNILVYDRAQCGTPNDIMSLSRDQAVMDIHIDADLKTAKCTSPPHVALRPSSLGGVTSAISRRTTSPRPETRSRWPPSAHVVSDLGDTKYLTIYRITSFSHGNRSNFGGHLAGVLHIVIVAYLMSQW